MSLALAITNLITAAEGVSGLEVITDKREPGRSPYTLLITQGAHLRESLFGVSRVPQALDLTLSIKQPDPAAAAAIISSLEAAILVDRRRGGNAQTTTDPDDWTPSEDEGREGQELTSTVGVVVYES